MERKGFTVTFVEDEMEMVQQIIGEGFGVTGTLRGDNGRVQDADASSGAGLQRFVLFVGAAIGMELQQAFDEQNEVGVPIGVGGENWLLAEIAHVVESRIEKAEVGDRAGIGGELVAVAVYPEGRGERRGEREEDVMVIKVADDDVGLMKLAEGVVDLLEEVNNGLGLDAVFLAVEGVGKLFKRLAAIGEFGHLEAGDFSLNILHKGTGS